MPKMHIYENRGKRGASQWEFQIAFQTTRISAGRETGNMSDIWVN